MSVTLVKPFTSTSYDNYITNRLNGPSRFLSVELFFRDLDIQTLRML